MEGDEEQLTAADLVAYFRALPPAARQEFAVLADLDRRFGEDVAAERASVPRPSSADGAS